jgi:DNA-binding NarL/FixJ family response regulator
MASAGTVAEPARAIIAASAAAGSTQRPCSKTACAMREISVIAERRALGEYAPVSQTTLTLRELDVLRLVADGAGNVEIARTLHIGLGTVKGHVHAILMKLYANDRTHAAVRAVRRGYI